MKEAYWGYWLILLGIFVIVIMMLVNSVTTTTTQDYYLIKETTEAAMIDAVDYGYYREYGELRINKEKFVENFLRRFSETVNINKTYDVDFYDIYEAPPKVSVKVTTKSNSYVVSSTSESYDIVNKIEIDEKLRIPYYEDLYLDIVVKDDNIKILDEDEFENAFKDKSITINQYELAKNVMNNLVTEIKQRKDIININIQELLENN